MQHEPLISIAAAAKELGLNRSTLTRQVAKGLVRSHKGKVRISEVRADRSDRVAKPIGGARSDDVACNNHATANTSALKDVAARLVLDGKVFATEAEAKRHKESFLAHLRELEFRRKNDELVEVAEVVAQWSKELSIVRNRLLAIPSKAAARVNPEVRRLVHDFVEQEVHDALNELSRRGDHEEAERDAVEAKAPRSRRNRRRSEGAEK